MSDVLPTDFVLHINVTVVYPPKGIYEAELEAN